MSSTNHGHEGPALGGPDQDAVKRGYEADTYDAKSVLSVPFLVVLFFVLAFGTVTLLFRWLAFPAGDPQAHPGAVARNKAPLNERMARLGRGKEVDQPRLEPLRVRTGDNDAARAITRPEAAEGNSPELHPEDLIPTKDRYPELFNSGANKYGIDRTLGLSDAALEKLFPVSKSGTKPGTSLTASTGSNAGRGVPPALPKAEAPPLPPVPVPAPKPKDLTPPVPPKPPEGKK
jgi:hypothetical protein